MYPARSRFVNFWSSVLTSGLSGAEHTQYIRKVRFLNSSLVLTVLIFVAVFFLHLRIDLPYYAFLDLSISILSFVIFFYLRVTKNIESASSLYLFMLIIMFQYLLITGVIGDFAILVIFLYPVSASFLKRYDQALYWSYYSVVSLSISLILNQYGVLTIPYSYLSIVILLGIYFLFFHLVYLLVQTSKIGEQTLISRSTQLYKANLQLSKEVSDRKTAEISLKEENARDDAIFSSLGEGMLVVDQDFLIVMANNAAQDLLGLKKESLISTSILDLPLFVGNDKKSNIPHPLQESFRMKKIVTSSDFSFRNNEKMLSYPVTITASPIIIYKKAVGGVLVFRDITHEKEIDRMKTDFISLASHQLRTPLTAMKWFLEILLSEDESKNLTKEQKQYLVDINSSNEREIALVNSLLNISRIESGRIIIEPQPTDLNELVESVISEIASKIQEKKHSVHTDINDAIGKISIDPKMTRQIFLNLISNAIKYTPSGGEISIKAEKKDNFVLISLQDNGMGIPRSAQKRMFERFYRAPNVFKVETEGTGLGLYLAKAIVEAQGGKIWYESQESQGSTFYFTLPLFGVKPQEGKVSLAS